MSGMLSEKLMTAQGAVLGSMLIDTATIGGVMAQVSESDFTDGKYRAIFAVIRSQFSAGRPVDPVTINERLGGNYERILYQLVEWTPTAANCGEYVELLKQSSMLYHLQELGLQLSAAADLDEAQKQVESINAMSCTRSGIVARGMRELYDRFCDRHDGTAKPDHLRFGIPALDERVFAEPGDMLILGGYPSDGKSALALSMGFELAAAGRRVGYFTYESNNDKLFDRIVAAQTLTSFGKIKQDKLTEEDWRTIVDLQDKLIKPYFTLIEAAGMTVADVQAYSLANRYDVVIVDYLQKVRPDRAQRSALRFEQVSAISSGLQQFGRQSGTAVVALSQFSRPEKRKDGTVPSPTMSSLRESGQIEQDGDIILLLYRNEQGGTSAARNLKIAKNKDGEAGLILQLHFDGDTQTFSRSQAKPPEPPKKEPDQQLELFHPISNDPNAPF